MNRPEGILRFAGGYPGSEMTSRYPAKSGNHAPAVPVLPGFNVILQDLFHLLCGDNFPGT
jgi:hypothetical protein